MRIAKNLKKIRVSLCLDQSEFAHLLGISKASISNYERGARFPRMSTCRKILDIAKNNKIDLKIQDISSNNED